MPQNKFLALVPCLFILHACGDSSTSGLQDKVGNAAGVFERHSIVERDPAIAVEASQGQIEGLNYFPTTLPKTTSSGTTRFGEDVFWTFAPGTRFSIQADPQKVLPDQKLLEVSLKAGLSYPVGGFFHSEFDTFAGVGENWKTEFQPHYRVKGSSNSLTPVILKVDETWVCSVFQTDGTINTVNEQKRTVQTEPILLKTGYQDLKLPLEVTGPKYRAFETDCGMKKGSIASYLEMSVIGGEREERTLQFIELRVIKEQLF